MAHIPKESGVDIPPVGKSILSEREKLDTLSAPGVALPYRSEFEGTERAIAYPASFVQRKELPLQEALDFLRIGTAGQGGLRPVQPTVAVSFTEQDKKVLREKQEAKEAKEFETWLIECFPPSILCNRDLIMKHYPEYFTEREEYQAKLAKLELDYHKLCIRGIQSREDFIFLYEIWKNPELANKILTGLGPSMAASRADLLPAAEGNFQRGLFSPLRREMREAMSETYRTASAQQRQAAAPYPPMAHDYAFTLARRGPRNF